ncbi:M16 family metallopeptidase [Thermogutta sp.]|uniref:M16 family metallopeptidase n=1 Tax=Thermogutta sp. TaxID=1962930 RepID=UPI003C7BF89E
MSFYSHKLWNGVEVICESHPRALSIALGFFVRAGSRDEPPELAGVSHFLEHMAFKGTGRITSEDINRGFDEIGASYNATTSFEETVYYAVFLPEYLDRAFELLALLLRPALRQEDFELEKQVILEEISMYLDQPPYGVDDLCRARFFAGHPLGQSVIGTTESISRLTVEQMRSYYNQRYTATNVVIAATGAVEFPKLVALAEKHCSHLEPIESERIRQRLLEPAYGLRVHQKPTATQEYVIQLAEAPPADSPDRFAAQMLAAIVSGSSSSRLYWEFIEPGRVDSISLSYEGYEDAGVFATLMSCDPGMLQENLQRLREVYTAIEQHGVTAEELERVKNKLMSSLALAAERPSARLFPVGSERLTTGQYRSLEDDLAIIEKLTLEQVNAVAEKYPLTCNATDVIGPMSPEEFHKAN